MTNAKTKIAGLIAGSALFVGAVPMAQATVDAAPQEPAVPDPAAVAASENSAGQVQKTIAKVEGFFSWNQEVSTSTKELAKNLYEASDYLCGAQATEGLEANGKAQLGDSIEVGGDVGKAFTASVAELEKQAPARKIMGCTCYGNPADGKASANAQVSGFELRALIKAARPAEDANTITFTCADGYKVALPLSYVAQRYSIIVTAINDEAAKDAVGCTNQLWLGSTSARSFARDIVAIDITSEANPPAAPGATSVTPNVGVSAARSA